MEILHGPSMLPDNEKFMECSIINPVMRKRLLISTYLVSAKKFLISRLFTR